jgi:tRNA threonylcarbamoyladenosine dehydratase
MGRLQIPNVEFGEVHLSPLAMVDRRLTSLQRLYGPEAAQRIASAHVVVVGIGGVGSWSAESLARSGVGRLTLIDMDHVSESNINRQIHATDGNIGQSKVLAMQQRIASFQPTCDVIAVDAFVEPDNWPLIAGESVDAVIDACDQSSAKLTMAAWALHASVPFICVGAAGGKRLPHWVEIADLGQVTHDPLLARLRQKLRHQFAAPRGQTMGLTCVFSKEVVTPPPASCEPMEDGGLNCHGLGSVVSVTATFGQCAAGWVINALANAPLPKATKNSL